MKILWCLHGNLQQPSVWNDLRREIAPALGVQVRMVSLWEPLASSCWEWAEQFCQQVQVERTHDSDADIVTEQYLLGYSLGGRLAFHALLVKPELWSRAVIVSADSESSGVQGLKRDRIWANRFLTEPWQPLLREWDALPVFCHYPCTISRVETDFDRGKIAHVFENYSKGKMDSLRPHLKALSTPITYIAGSDDQRYCQLGQFLAAECTNLTYVTIPQAGHRVPWEQPQNFLKALTVALTTL